MKNFCPLLGLFLLFGTLFTGPALYSAQEVDIGITRQHLARIKIDVANFTPEAKSDPRLANDLINILKNDFNLVDYLEPVANSSDAQLKLTCTYTLSGNNQLTIKGKLYETKKGRMILGKRFSGTVEQCRKLIHSLTDSIITNVIGEQGIAATRLAFEHPASGNKQIFISDFDGHGLFQLTKDPCPSLFPHWSHRRDKIIYTSYLYHFPQTFIYNISHGTRNRICAYPGLNTSASFSPNGRKVALTLSKDGNSEIYTVNTDGTRLTRITRARSVDTAPCWSPDGQKIAFVSNRSGSPQIYIVNSQGGSARRLTYEGSYNANPNWSPKEDLIVYNSSQGGIFQILTTDVNTGQTTQITHGPASCENPSFAADGRHIVFSRTKGYNSALCIMDIFFRESHILPMPRGNYTNPDWSS